MSQRNNALLLTNDILRSPTQDNTLAKRGTHKRDEEPDQMPHRAGPPLGAFLYTFAAHYLTI